LGLIGRVGGALKVNTSTALGNDGSDHNAPAKARLREAILRYVLQHPDVADTADGIIGWWLPLTGYEDAPDHIDAVLEEMVATNYLRAWKKPDGEFLYQCGDAADILGRRNHFA